MAAGEGAAAIVGGMGMSGAGLGSPDANHHSEAAAATPTLGLDTQRCVR